MKLVILAGGKGTRLSEFTKVIPKPLSLVGDFPLIFHLMYYYSHFGIRDFIICSGYKSKLIENFFKEKISLKFKKILKKWNIKIVNTGIYTNTGGRVKRVENLLKNEDNFLLTYGDALSDINIKKLINFHYKSINPATISVVLNKERFGKVLIKKNNLVKFEEKRAITLINGGFMVLSSKIFKILKSDKDILEEKVLEFYSKKKMLNGYLHRGFWQCVDNYRDWEFINQIYKEKKITNVFIK